MSSKGLNMVAEVKNQTKERYTIVTLASDGSNVRAWMISFVNMLHMHQLNHLATEHYSMYVHARETMSLNIKAQAERDIKEERAERAANDRYAGATEVKTNVGASKKASKKKDKGAEEKAADDTKELVSAQVSAHTHKRKKREEKRRACAEELAREIEMQEGRGQGHKGDSMTVSFLDPLSRLSMSDSDDDELVCHRHTLKGVQHRYAVEKRSVTKIRMRIDDALSQSARAIPAHITVGVMPGDIYLRYHRVRTHYDNLSTQVRKAEVDKKISTLTFRERESFETFTSRFRALEHEMEDVGLQKDPCLLLGALKHAIGGTKSASKREVYRAFGVLGGGKDKEELLDGLKEPMLEAEQREKEEAPDRKATVLYQERVQYQERVNALHVAQHGKGGRGSGGKGSGRGKGKGKGGKGSMPCLRFAKGECTFTNCYYKHTSLNPQQIRELETKIETAKASKTGKGGVSQDKKVSIATHSEKTDGALESAVAECRALGMDDELMMRLTGHILKHKH
jgi:hypothetical protein